VIEGRRGEGNAVLELSELGEFEVIRNGSPATLPPSRKFMMASV
jgi:hypothetical protein